MIDWNKPICTQNGKPLEVVITYSDGVREVMRPSGSPLPCGWDSAFFHENGEPFCGETYTIRNVREKKTPRRKN